MKKGRLIFLVFTLALFTSVSSFAQQIVQGQGRFNSTSDDSLSFVRSQLLYKAFRDVLNKELKSMGLDAQGFWRKYESRFEKSFESVENELRTEYGLDDDSDVSSSDREEFKEKLRLKRLSSQAAFGNLARAIESYSIKNMSRSAQAAQSRFLTLEAKVNRRMLNSIYSEFMQEGKRRFFSQLYLTPKFRLREGSWSDLGVKSKVDFTEVVEKHWKNWLSSKLSRSVQEVVVTDEDQIQRIQDFLKIPADNAETFLGLGDESKEDVDLDFVQGEEIETQRLESSLANSLWLEMTIDIVKTDENLLHGQRGFSYSGKFLLMDLKTREVLLAYDIDGQEHSYQTQDPQNLSSSIASFVYRMPMGGLEKLAPTLAKVDSRSQSYMLEVKNLTSIRDLELFNEMLSKEGLTEEFDPQVISFDGLNARVKLNFKGERPKALGRLRSLHLRSLNAQTTAIVESVERPFEFRLEHRLSPPLDEENSEELIKSSSL